MEAPSSFSRTRLAQSYGYCDSASVDDALKKRVLDNAAGAWDSFYGHNVNHFFKDRHWLTREFPSLLKPVLICELGCGVGNSTFPLLHENPTLRFHCCDFSAQAVDILRKNEKFNAANILSAFVADVSNTQQVLQVVPVHSCDVALFIFVLSAMPPEAVSRAICTAREVLKVGGEVLVRDYAEGDGAHVRYLETPASRVIDRNLCIRGDGTQAYFFPLDMLRRLFEEQGFDGTDCKVIDAEPSAQGGLPRKYVQGRFILKSHKG